MEDLKKEFILDTTNNH